MTATFFRKYADVNNSARFGESYDWFFRNLKNANDTISLRPFIDLTSEAVKWSINEDKTEEPILTQSYYTRGKAWEHGVERHVHLKWAFETLAEGVFRTEAVWRFARSRGMKITRNSFGYA